MQISFIIHHEFVSDCTISTPIISNAMLM